jgi:hypothetical protein
MSKRSAALTLSVFTCLCLALATERRAMAYIDPGQGLVFVQSIGAAFAATAYFLRRRILALFSKRKPAESVTMPVGTTREAAVQKGSTRNAA